MTLQEILAICIVICVIGFLLLIGVLIFAYLFVQAQMRRYLVPNPLEIRRDLERLSRLYPGLSEEQVALTVIKSTALFTGVIGFVTGLGGFFVLLLGLPLNMAVCTRRQMKMVQVITAVFGNADLDPDTLQTRYVALVLGGAGVGWILKQTVPRIFGESIPVLGGVLGFAFNWFATRSIGEAAITWNRNETLRGRASAKYQELKQRVIPPSSLPASHTEFIESAATQHAKPLPISLKLKFCPTCGNSWSNEELFCTRDGTPLPMN